MKIQIHESEFNLIHLRQVAVEQAGIALRVAEQRAKEASEVLNQVVGCVAQVHGAEKSQEFQGFILSRDGANCSLDLQEMEKPTTVDASPQE